MLLPCVVSKAARARLDSNIYSVPPEWTGQTVHLHSHDTNVRLVRTGPSRRPSTSCASMQRERIFHFGPEAHLYVLESARRRICVDHESRTLNRLLELYGEAGVMRAMALALAQRALGARNAPPVSLLNDLMRKHLRVLSAFRRTAIFPLIRLDGYDFSYPKGIDRELVARAATLDFVRKKSNVVFIGTSGVGNTQPANATGQLACLQCYRGRFVAAADLVNDLVAGQGKNTLLLSPRAEAVGLVVPGLKRSSPPRSIRRAFRRAFFTSKICLRDPLGSRLCKTELS